MIMRLQESILKRYDENRFLLFADRGQSRMKNRWGVGELPGTRWGQLSVKNQVMMPGAQRSPFFTAMKTGVEGPDLIRETVRKPVSHLESIETTSCHVRKMREGRNSHSPHLDVVKTGEEVFRPRVNFLGEKKLDRSKEKKLQDLKTRSKAPMFSGSNSCRRQGSRDTKTEINSVKAPFTKRWSR